MHCTRQGLWLLMATTVFAASGASCPQTVQQYASPLPRVLPPSPTLDQVIQAVNTNSSQIQSFHTSQGSLSGPGFPTLRAMVAYHRQRLFRLRAELSLTGPEVDLGSNNDLFWFWIRRNQPPALFFCRYEQYYTTGIRHRLAIDPEWMIEAFGVNEFNPGLPHQGPYPLPGDRVEIRTLRETAQGSQTKITIVDAIRGVVLEQHILDTQGQRIASSTSSRHRRDPATGLVMPMLVTVKTPASPGGLTIDLGNVQINKLNEAATELWVPPSYPGATPVDLADPRAPIPQAVMNGPQTIEPPRIAAPPSGGNWFRRTR